MANQKSILELIHPPMQAEEKSDISSDEIDITGKHSSLSIEAGKYITFDIVNSELTDLMSSNVICYRASLLRASFIKAQLTGLQTPEAHIKDVVFEKCRINLSNFRRVKFERCVFVECDLREADFISAQMVNVLFENCEVAQAEFSGAICKRVQFTETNLSEINGITGLKGATISEQNLIELAPLLAQQMDLTIV